MKIEDKITKRLDEGIGTGTYQVKHTGMDPDDVKYYKGSDRSTSGFYFEPRKVLERAQDIKEVEDALLVVKKFERTCRELVG